MPVSFLKMQDGRQDTKGKSCGFTSLLVGHHEKASVTTRVAAKAGKQIVHGKLAEAKPTIVKLRVRTS